MKLRNYLGYINTLPKSCRKLKQLLFQDGLISVLICHDIQFRDMQLFYQQLHYLKKHYTFIDGKSFKKIMSGEEKAKGLNLLLTFDDGFKSNYIVAKQILDKLNIKAIFFISSDFINCTDENEIKIFISKNLYLGQINIDEISNEMKPMSWEDIEELYNTGHDIGAHTLSHCRLSSILNKKELYREIVECKNELQKRIGNHIDYFAYPFGDCGSISKQALKICKEEYKFVFSGVRGHNSVSTNPMALRREEISLSYELSYLKFLVEGGLSPYYYFDSKKLDSMAE